MEDVTNSGRHAAGRLSAKEVSHGEKRKKGKRQKEG